MAEPGSPSSSGGGTSEGPRAPAGGRPEERPPGARSGPDPVVILDAIPVPIFFKDAQGVYLGCNRAFADYLGRPRDEIVGRTVHDIAPRDLAAVYQSADRALLDAGGVQAYEAQVRFADGSRHDVVFNKATFPGAGGALGGLVGVIFDVTEQKQAERAQGEERYRAVVDSLEEGVALLSTGGELLACNPAAERILGNPGRILSESSWRGVLEDGSALPFQATPLAHALRTGEAGPAIELGVDRDDGRRAWISMRAWPLHRSGEERPFAVCASFTDVSDRKLAQAQLHHQASHDALTELPNRATFLDRLARLVAGASRHGYRLAVAYLDVDRFRVLNDTLGHAAGDRLLQELARRLAGCMRARDMIARTGPDEFCVILPGLQGREVAALAAERMLAAVRPPFDLAGHRIHVSLSIGVAQYPDDGGDSHALIRCADRAMHRARAEGKNQVRFFAPGMRGVSDLGLESDLHGAADRGELELHVQPIVHLASARVAAVEALLRWNHPRLGLVMPDRIIPIAEETGLIVPIGGWVLREACRLAKDWQREYGLALRIAVNVSAIQFRREDFTGEVASALAEADLAPQLLELELTESTLAGDEAIEKMRTLRSLGVHLALDDFGVGYSSLSSLRTLPVSTLKIDRSFVGDDASSPLLGPIVRLGHNLGLRVVAEGAETHEQLKRLRAMHCDLAQGFALGVPQAARLLAPRLARLRHDRPHLAIQR